MASRPFDFQKLLRDVFETTGSERFGILVDVPAGPLLDRPGWQERRDMAEEWRARLESLSYKVLPPITYAATGAHNADLPADVEQHGILRDLDVVLEECDILLAMTEFSATAPLAMRLARHPHLRVASMPGVSKRMEHSALAANYQQVAERVRQLRRLLDASQGARVHFESGHEVYFDLRHRQAKGDEGHCPPGVADNRLINLPSGEAFKVPYEGEVAFRPSGTIGVAPVMAGDDVAQFFIEFNRVVDVAGSGSLADYYQALFAEDEARRNVAEFGLGCNEAALVSGNALEDEKAGFHWAFGRSDHLGGTVGPSRFKSAATVLHQDLVYAPNSPIKAQRIDLTLDNGENLVLLDGDKYLYPSTLRMRELGLA
jgi:aminopeptidase